MLFQVSHLVFALPQLHLPLLDCLSLLRLQLRLVNIGLSQLLLDSLQLLLSPVKLLLFVLRDGDSLLQLLDEQVLLVQSDHQLFLLFAVLLEVLLVLGVSLDVLLVGSLLLQ